METTHTAEENLRLIRNMIDKAKTDMSGRAGHFLVWGWLTFIACSAQFVLKHFLAYPRHYLVWLLMVIGIVYSNIVFAKDARKAKVRSYVGDSMMSLWLGMGISYLVLSIVLTKVGWGGTVYPFFIILYALGTFVSGFILRFRPLIIGGSLSWILAIIAVFLSYDYQILMAALSILTSYIIPAHMLQARKTV